MRWRDGAASSGILAPGEIVSCANDVIAGWPAQGRARRTLLTALVGRRFYNLLLGLGLGPRLELLLDILCQVAQRLSVVLVELAGQVVHDAQSPDVVPAG